ncbi:hypothetical protein NDU88_003928 [Pleurodeles waltl]|uniref:Uncharacterized protein n=1 Tax=Pleurodeles waltl TaxID=8319 RepID=A0AAV7LJY8_PLEWA|nr:hypothetical protein NDU88_003928 [Pleurodeles waltl]
MNLFIMIEKKTPPADPEEVAQPYRSRCRSGFHVAICTDSDVRGGGEQKPHQPSDNFTSDRSEVEDGRRQGWIFIRTVG